MIVDEGDKMAVWSVGKTVVVEGGVVRWQFG